MYVSSDALMVRELNRLAREDSTRHALLQAAGRVFAEAGFRDATIRQICRAAGANVAAVNYHFGDKDTLYLEVLRHAHRSANARFPLDKIDSSLPPEQRLSLFIENFLRRLFSPGPESWMAGLMSREMIEPTRALHVIVNEEIRPNSIELSSIIRDLLGKGATAETARFCSMSVVSQCLFYHHCRPVIGLLFPQLNLGENSAGPIAAHITRFCLAALRDFSQPRPG
jgi:AcrR family transcriptional regulator